LVEAQPSAERHSTAGEFLVVRRGEGEAFRIVRGWEENPKGGDAGGGHSDLGLSRKRRDHDKEKTVRRM